MASPILSAFERDILSQPDVLEAFAAMPPPAVPEVAAFDRIILTGMGSSDYVTIPLELALARRGLPVWRLQTGCLLERMALITDRTLLCITSQSGRSGEVVELLARLPQPRRCTVVAVCNDTQSPLAQGADHVLPILSGDEATVSCKSYVNSLAALHRVAARLEGRSDSLAVAEIVSAAQHLRRFLADPGQYAAQVAARAAAQGPPRLALVGTGADAATALTGGLILKEAAKVCAEGYVGGAFRHGPMELGGPGLTVLLFGAQADDVTLERLAEDLPRTGSQVVAVTPRPLAGIGHHAVPEAGGFARLVLAMAFVQQLCVALARQAGLVPGEFRFGQKITAQL